MAQQNFSNGESGQSVRDKITANFTELYPKRIQITDQGTPITFNPIVPDGVLFEIIPISCRYLGQDVGVSFENVTESGMVARSAEPIAILIYQILTFPE
jgi:hypothetical protein